MAVRNPLVLVAGAVQELPTGDTINGATGGGGNSVTKYAIVGTLQTGIGTPRWYPDRSVTISSVYFSLGTAGTATIDVLKNGTSIFSGSKPQTTAANKSSVISVSVSMTVSDYLTVSVQVAGGADATVYIVYS